MRDNLIFSGILKHPSDNPEALIKDFTKIQLKLPPDTVNQITIHRVHCLTLAHANKSHRPIIAKLEHFKHRELIKSQGKELVSTGPPTGKQELVSVGPRTGNQEQVFAGSPPGKQELVSAGPPTGNQEQVSAGH